MTYRVHVDTHSHCAKPILGDAYAIVSMESDEATTLADYGDAIVCDYCEEWITDFDSRVVAMVIEGPAPW